MKRSTRLTAAISSAALTMGLLPLVAAPAAQAAVEGPCETKSNSTLGVCKPQTDPLPSPTSVTDGTRLTVEFRGFAHADFSRWGTTGTEAGFFRVAGFIDRGTACRYTPQMSHLNTGQPVRLSNGLVVSVEEWSTSVVGHVSGFEATNVTTTHQFSTPTQAGKTFCALSGVAITVKDGLGSTIIADSLVSDPLTIDITTRTPGGNVIANTPDITVSRPSEPFTFRSPFQIVSTVGGDIERGAIASRLLHIGTAAQNGGECTGVAGSPRYYWNITDSLKRVNVFTGTVSSRDDAGRWLCAYQTVLNTNGFESTSGTAYQSIDALPADDPAAADLAVPTVNVTSLLSRLTSTTNALRTALAQPQVNQAEVDRLIAEAEAARQEAQEAVQNGAVNAGNAANAGGAGNGGNAGGAAAPTVTVAQIAEEVDRTNELIARGGGAETPRSALEAATGFDATITPLIPRNTPTASGLMLDVTSPKTAKKKRAFKVKVSVDPREVRGRMRMFLVYLDGDTPKLVHKRSGFIGKQRSKTKKFYINRTDKKGNYAILTSFDPTTPGDAGVATLTPLRVR